MTKKPSLCPISIYPSFCFHCNAYSCFFFFFLLLFGEGGGRGEGGTRALRDKRENKVLAFFFSFRDFPNAITWAMLWDNTNIRKDSFLASKNSQIKR